MLSAKKSNFWRDWSKRIHCKIFKTQMSFLTYKIRTTPFVCFLTLIAKYFELKIVLISHRVHAILCVFSNVSFCFIFKKILEIELSVKLLSYSTTKKSEFYLKYYWRYSTLKFTNFEGIDILMKRLIPLVPNCAVQSCRVDKRAKIWNAYKMVKLHFFRISNIKYNL